MLIGNSQYSKNFKERKDYECPFTIIYDLEVPSGNYTYSFGLMNPNSVSAAYIEWGDGSSNSIKSSGNYFNKFNHSYSKAGTYEVKFKMNAEIDLARSSFFLISPPDQVLSSSISSIFENLNAPFFNAKNRILIKDFNDTEFGDAMSLSYTNPFYGTESVTISNNLLHRIKKSKNVDSYDAISFSNIKSNSRDFIRAHKENTNRKFLNFSLNFPNVEHLPSALYSTHSMFYNSNLPSLRELNTMILDQSTFHSSTVGSRINAEKTIGTSINENCFYYCNNLQEILCSNDLKYIENNAFCACSQLSSIRIPSVVKVSQNAFKFDMNLSNVYAPKLEEIDSYAFAGVSTQSAHLNLHLPSLHICNENAFSENGNIKSVNFPLLKELKDSTFYYCQNLTNVDVPSVSSIGPNCFFSNSSLSSVNAPNVESISNLRICIFTKSD